MPVQVNEIIIRAVVDSRAGSERGPSSGGSADRGEIISECVEQVLEILRERQER